jgi:Zn finger protein HypA/HybF involved in hydrogenase expression
VSVLHEDPEEAAALTSALISFLEEPANCKCADCAAPFHAHNEAWASVNLGVLVCVNCATVHRSVRSPSPSPESQPYP